MPGDKPFDIVANMSVINGILREYRDGRITREECRRRLMEDCRVEDYNLDPLLSAYDPKAGDNE